MLTLKRKPSAKFKTLTVLVTVLIFASCMFASAGEDSRQASVLDLFPSSGIPSGKGEASCSFDYVASGSTWNPKVDEKAVFLASFKGEGWQLGVGKGGHIYSLRGPYGESVPPQRVSSPWNDEVYGSKVGRGLRYDEYGDQSCPRKLANGMLRGNPSQHRRSR